MSGTSADGVDVALCCIGSRWPVPRFDLLVHQQTRYPKVLREAVLRAMTADPTDVPTLSRLNWRLGAFYAECVARAAEGTGVQVDLVGCHGQTIYHQPVASRSLGAPVRCTWQTGEAAIIAPYSGVTRCATLAVDASPTGP